MEGQPYKQELINDLPEGEEISFYKQGDFTDLCAGPHLMSTGKVKAVKGKKGTVKITARAVDGSRKKATIKIRIK